MSSTIVLSNKSGSVSVDFTNLGATVKYKFTNPFFTFATPQAAEELTGKNTYCINLGLVSNVFNIEFTLKDGPGTYNFKTPGGTNFEKISYLANYVKNPKYLTLYGTQFTGHIDAVDIQWVEGHKNIATNCIVSFILTADINME
jgi:hypothetical protein